MSAPNPGQMFSLEDRPDYMLEAFLDEQSILVKPLLLRRLSLLATLDLQAQLTEKAHTSPTPPAKKPRLPADAGQDRVLSEMLSLTEEKILIAKQLQDIAFKQLDSLLEVEAALEAVAKKERDEAPPRPQNTGSTSRAAATSGSKATQSALVAVTASPIDEELWCICRKPDDGRPMVACDNQKCALTWWHVDCVARHIATRGVGSMPDEASSWFCPTCTGEKPTAQSPPAPRRRVKQE